MVRAREATRTAQAWIEPMADDPEAMSALAVARGRLRAGGALQGLRRLRVFELRGALPDRAAITTLLHRSIQFYNPAKERCTVRLDPREASPLARGEIGLLVLERGGERRPGAERWWRHETGGRAEIREGVAWVLRFGAGAKAEEAARDLATLRDRDHGLLCNPHWQESRLAPGAIPLPWITGGSTGEDAAPRVATARARSGRNAAPGAQGARRASKGKPARAARAGASRAQRPGRVRRRRIEK